MLLESTSSLTGMFAVGTAATSRTGMGRKETTAHVEVFAGMFTTQESKTMPYASRYTVMLPAVADRGRILNVRFAAPSVKASVLVGGENSSWANTEACSSASRSIVMWWIAVRSLYIPGWLDGWLLCSSKRLHVSCGLVTHSCPLMTLIHVSCGLVTH